MKTKQRGVLGLAVALFAFNSAYAFRDITKGAQSSGNGSNSNNNLTQRASNCSPGSALTKLEYNNVRALIEQGGSQWYDRSSGTAAYEWPKTHIGSGDQKHHVIYAGALWMGGEDGTGQLKLAAIDFRDDGNDYWPGPLDSVNAEINPVVCADYDKFFELKRQDVFNFYTAVSTTGAPPSGYPQSFNEYAMAAFGPQGQPMAPFYDWNNDGLYDPANGDFPWFQFKKTITELPCGNDRRVTLYGDYAIWWVFNDKGNIHTESAGEAIGVEIHAQAFAFNTSDEVNDMTFYNYEIINRSHFPLYKTYFAQWADPDLGCANDDFVGCDVQRGLGYCFNGQNIDGNCNGEFGYGSNPPAVGIDYFQGPYQDNDNVDNPLTTNVIQAIAQGGIPYEGLGVGYSDNVIDNERFGMRKFIYYVNDQSQRGNPESANHFYNYLAGFWKDNTDLFFGGNGYFNDPDVIAAGNIKADYMFPGDTDPYNWSTHGVAPAVGVPWTEVSASNQYGDRRFAQSSGPFTLKAGAKNDITVGIVTARALSGGPLASVQRLRIADDKAQALFNSCFKILDGPDAPDLTVQELDREIILHITNAPNSFNYNEKYSEHDPFIIIPDTLNGVPMSQADKDTLTYYKFQGYKVFQLANSSVSSSDLGNPDKARLIYQCDIKDGIGKIINFIKDEDLGFSIPTLMVDGADQGIKHTLQVKTDAFTQGNLINHKTYYYMALAYAYNNYGNYNPDPQNPSEGQTKLYLESRKSVNGAIQSYAAIPHIPTVENGGTQANSGYGDGPIITRIEGQGNGGLYMDITPSSENIIVSNSIDPHVSYFGGQGKGPVEIKVIDPLNVPSSNYRIWFTPDTTGNIDNSSWTLEDLNSGQQWNSDKTIEVGNEQIIPEIGLSITIEQYRYLENPNTKDYAELISSSVVFADSSKRWLSGIVDQEGTNTMNWIRSGIQEDANPHTYCGDGKSFDDKQMDEPEAYEAVAGGIIAPYILAAYSYQDADPEATDIYCLDNWPVSNENRLSQTLAESDWRQVNGIDIVFTNDKSKWTRCPVVETQDDPALSIGGVKKQRMRTAQSVDKNGNPAPVGSGASNNPNDPNYISEKGMGWFPGYAINVETGERLNMAFGEDSWMQIDNGRDMQWNPTSRITSDRGETIWGGKHYIYVFRNTIDDPWNTLPFSDKSPRYDAGAWLASKIHSTSSSTDMRNGWRGCMWVMLPTLANGQTLGACDVRIKARVKKPYERYNPYNTGLNDPSSQNNWYNMYEFGTANLASHTSYTDYNDSILALINVVPNPYYAYSAYERNKLDNRIKIVNLPDVCNINIYNVSGSLIRTITKSTNSITSVDWDLKNSKGIPISGGVYLIHVEVPGVGERILKWFGAMRPTDLSSF